MTINWLEWLNTFVLNLAFWVIVVFSLIMWQERRSSDRAVFAALIASCVTMFGEATRNLWYWLWGHFGQRDPNWLTGNRILLLYLFTACLALGLLCSIRVFTQHRFGQWGWVLTLVISFVVATTMVMLP